MLSSVIRTGIFFPPVGMWIIIDITMRTILWQRPLQQHIVNMEIMIILRVVLICRIYTGSQFHLCGFISILLLLDKANAVESNFIAMIFNFIGMLFTEIFNCSDFDILHVYHTLTGTMPLRSI